MTAEPRGILLVYYSRSGNTRQVARAIAARLDCDVEELRPVHRRSGFTGYVRSALETYLGTRAKLLPARYDPRGYDLVILGTPVWAGRVSSVVRTYLAEHAGQCRRVAFFLTQGDPSGYPPIFRQLRHLSRHKPVATLALSERDLEGSGWDAKVQAFVEAVRRTSPVAAGRVTDAAEPSPHGM